MCNWNLLHTNPTLSNPLDIADFEQVNAGWVKLN